MKQSLPVRQCVVCREKKTKPFLFRFVKGESNTIILDENQKINQRGIYCCKTPACVKKAKDYHILENAWKGSIRPELYLYLAQAVSTSPEQQIQSLIGLSVKSGQVVIGITAIERTLSKHSIHLIVIDPALGVHTNKAINHLAVKHTIRIVTLPENMSLEQITGKPNCRVLGLTNLNIARTLSHCMNPME